MDKHYAMNSAAAGQLPPTSCFTRLEASISNLRSVRNRVSALTDMLAGSVPEACSIVAENGAGGGAFDRIDAGAEDINQLCDQIGSYLARIEKRL